LDGSIITGRDDTTQAEPHHQQLGLALSRQKKPFLLRGHPVHYLERGAHASHAFATLDKCGLFADTSRVDRRHATLGERDLLRQRLAQRNGVGGLGRVIANLAFEPVDRGTELGRQLVDLNFHAWVARQGIAAVIRLNRADMVAQFGDPHLNMQRMCGPLARSALRVCQEERGDGRHDGDDQAGNGQIWNSTSGCPHGDFF